MDGDWLLCISMVVLHGVRADEGVVRFPSG